MHDPELVHFLEPTGQTMHELLDFQHAEIRLLLVDACMELSVGEKLHDQVERVVGFENTFELHQVGAVPDSEQFDLV
jgi:hypothetical protein